MIEDGVLLPCYVLFTPYVLGFVPTCTHSHRLAPNRTNSYQFVPILIGLPTGLKLTCSLPSLYSIRMLCLCVCLRFCFGFCFTFAQIRGVLEGHKKGWHGLLPARLSMRLPTGATLRRRSFRGANG